MSNNRFCSALRLCIVCSEKSNDVYRRVRHLANIFFSLFSLYSN